MAKKPPSYKDAKTTSGLQRHEAPPKPFVPDGASYWWWEEAGSDAEAMGVTGTINAIIEQSQGLMHLNQHHHRLYSGAQSVMGMIGPEGTASNFMTAQTRSMGTMGPAYNVIQSCCDTATAKIAGNTPRALFVTKGGDYKAIRKARDLNRFARGIEEQLRLKQLQQAGFLDSTIFGQGVLKFFKQDGLVACEKVYPNDFLIDAGEAMYGAPRNVYQRRYIARDVLSEMFPGKDKSAAIRELPRENFGWRQAQADLVLVGEAFHLPSAPDAGDGRHVIAAGGICLFHEEWKRARFPYALIRWAKPPTGYWGQGLAEQLFHLQLEINRVLGKISHSHNMASVPQVWVDASAKIDKSHINNEIGAIGVYSGNPPVFRTGSGVAPELAQYLESLFAKAYQIAGISEMSAQAQKPQGLDSKPAMETYHDIETERFQIVGQAYEQFICDCSELAIDEAIDLDEQGASVESSWVNQGQAQKISWKSIHMDRDEFMIRPQPVSQVPDTLAGGIELTQTMMQLGVATPIQGLAQMELGDTVPFIRTVTARYEWAMEILDKMVEEGKSTQPEPYMDLAMTLELAKQRYALAQVSEVPEERLDLLRQFMDAIQGLMSPPASQGAPAGPPGSPLAVPAPPPVSQMLPNAPQPQGAQ